MYNQHDLEIHVSRLEAACGRGSPGLIRGAFSMQIS